MKSSAFTYAQLRHDAEQEALTWPGPVLNYVTRAKPDVFRGLETTEWVVTVALCRKDDENPQMTADRLHQYVTLYIERHGISPSMRTLQGTP